MMAYQEIQKRTYQLGTSSFYAHGRLNEICQQADGRPAREQGK